MIKLGKIVVILIFGAFLILPGAALAQDPKAKQLELIKTNCTILHDNVDLQRRRDLVTRTNRGREYESLNKQLDAFGQRLRNNQIDAQKYDNLFKVFQDEIRQFRAAYEDYDTSLGELLQISCQNDPAKFADKLNQARERRSAIGEATSKIDEALANYRKEVVALKAQVQKVSNDTSEGNQ